MSATHQIAARAVAVADGSAPVTMSSREIADLTGKRHAHVIRDIRTMLIGLYGDEEVERLVPAQYRNRHSEYVRENADAIFSAIVRDEPDWVHGGRGFAWQRDKRGYIKGFDLDRSHSITVVTGYDVKARKAIIDRWEALETGRAEPIGRPIIDLSDPVAMRGYLLTYTEKVIALEATVAAAKPKADFFDRFVTADGLYGLQNAARALSCHPNKFVAWLKQRHLFYQGGSLVPYVEHRQSGHFEVKATVEGDRTFHRTFVTPKGLTALAKKIPDDIRISPAMPVLV